MNIKDYFTEKKGTGIIATSDKNGVVNTAIYSRPHVESADDVAFIMRSHLTHKNLQENEHANYMFIEQGPGYSGVRLFLTKVQESNDRELINSLTRRHMDDEDDRLKGEKFLVRFRIDKVLTLIGGNEIAIE